MLVFISIVIIHWIADFVLQDEKWAIGKSTSIQKLVKHTSLYSITWVPFLWLFYGDLNNALLFGFVTFIAHTLTDYYTSKIVKNRFDQGHYGSAIPNLGGYSMIGLDQVFHYIQLVVTWNLIFGI